MPTREKKALLGAYRSSIKQLEEQLSFYARKRAQEYAPYQVTEGSKQQFWYRADARGLIQMQNDSAFVCEQILAFPAGSPPVFPGAGAPSYAPPTWRFSLEDASSGRELTFAEVRVPNTADEPIPLEVLSPSALAADPYGDQNDYWFYGVTQYLIGRAAVLRLRVSNPPVAGLVLDAPDVETLLPNFVLGGYKVY